MIRSLNDDINVIENKGVKGPSVLMNLEGFDLSNGVVPDYMHSALLGVARQYTDLILSSPKAEYYVGAKSTCYYKSTNTVNSPSNVYNTVTKNPSRKTELESFRMAFLARVVYVNLSS